MVLETERLLLRAPDCVGAEAVADYAARNRAFMAEFEPVREAEYYTAQGQAELLRQQAADWEEGSGYRLYLSPKAEAAAVIGFVSLSGIVMRAFCSCFLGYQMDRLYLNRGLTSEAVEEAVRFGFERLGLHRVEANIMPRNAPSRRVAEKCGFVSEGQSEKYLKINGVWEDHIHYVRRNAAME